MASTPPRPVPHPALSLPVSAPLSSASDDDGDDLDDDLDPTDDYLPLEPHAQFDEDDAEESPEQRRERRRRMRRMYGGGRHRHGGPHAAGRAHGESTSAEDADGDGEGAVDPADGGGVGEVAGMVLAGALSPMPLVLPLACAQLGPGLFVPLLALASALAWLGAVVIGVEGRYVGARSFPALASGVFPHRFKLHKFGEFLAATFVLGGSVVRTALGVVATAELLVDLVVPERRRRDWERGIAVGVVCATWLLVPLVLPPIFSLLGLSRPPRGRSSSAEYTRLSSVSTPDLALAPGSPAFSLGPDSSPRPRPRWTALLNLPSWSVALLTWPIALLVLGVRMKRLNRDAAQPATAASALGLNLPLLSPSDDAGASLWPAILVTFAAPLAASHETFYYLASLARPSSTAAANSRERHTRAFSLAAAAAPSEDAHTHGGGAARWREREGRRNQYPLALLVGHAGAFLLSLGWALVGALSLPSALPAPNLLTDVRLPRADPFLSAVRLLVLAALTAQLEAHAAVGLGRARRALRSLSGSSAPGAHAARRAAARVLVWGAVGALAAVVVAVPALSREPGDGGGGVKHPRGHGEGMLRVVQWSGVVLGGVGGCVVPALTYLVLFHLRRPRSILLAPAPSASTSRSPDPTLTEPDALLARKERQMQRRLSGRRVWTDAGVFGLLAPVGVVLVIRGTVELVRG